MKTINEPSRRVDQTITAMNYYIDYLQSLIYKHINPYNLTIKELKKGMVDSVKKAAVRQGVSYSTCLDKSNRQGSKLAEKHLDLYVYVELILARNTTELKAILDELIVRNKRFGDIVRINQLMLRLRKLDATLINAEAKAV